MQQLVRMRRLTKSLEKKTIGKVRRFEGDNMGSRKHQTYSNGEIVELVEEISKEVEELKVAYHEDRYRHSIWDARATSFATVTLLIAIISLAIVTSVDLSRTESLAVGVAIVATMLFILYTFAAELIMTTRSWLRLREEASQPRKRP